MKSVFPVIYSTLAPQAIVTQVLSNYHLSTIRQCLFWNRGLSDVYLVETAKKSYILRISHHHWRSVEEVQFELELLDFLHGNYVPVASPLRTKDNSLLVKIPALEGDRYAALFNYAEGKIPLGDLDVNQSKILGETLGKLHQKSTDFNPSTNCKTLNPNKILDESFNIIAPFLENKKEDLEYLTKSIAKIKKKLNRLPKKYPFWSVCWGDPHSGNVHFTEDNNITLFDFDQCGYGWRAFDCAKFLQVSMGGGMSRRVRNSFFEGYESIGNLTPEEWDCLPTLTQMAHIWAWSISINAASIDCWSRLDSYFFSKRLEQLKTLSSPDCYLFSN